MLISFWLTTSVPAAEDRRAEEDGSMYLCDSKHYRDTTLGKTNKLFLEEKKIKIYPLMTPFE